MNDHVKKRVAGKFSQRELAMLMSTKQQSVSRWFNSKFPASRVLHLCQLMQWEVTPHELTQTFTGPKPTVYPLGVRLTHQAPELIHENQA